MRKVLRFLKRIWFLNFLRRIYFAKKILGHKNRQILKWGFTSKEDTNFTYFLQPNNVKYLANLIAVVTGKDYDIVLGYIREAENDKVLKETILAGIEQSPLRKFADKEIRFGRRLGWYAFVRVLKPKVVVETGVDKGLGSMILCAALLKNKEEGFPGKYYGTDINPQAGYLLSGKYKEVGEILYGDSIETLSAFKDQIDLFINDSDHSAQYEYDEYLTIKKLLNDSSIILGDNSDVTDKLQVFSNENNRNFAFFQERPLNHWYPGAGIGISYKKA